MMRFLLASAATLSVAASASAQELGNTWGTENAESEFYRIVDLPLPIDPQLEVGSFCALPDDKLAVGTRRGEILIISGAFEPLPKPTIHRFASGLDEVLGLGYRDGTFYATQQTEVTAISDKDGDGRADHFHNMSDAWGFGHYHEFAWGSPVQPDGSVYVALGLSESYHYKAPYRGFAFQVTADGKTVPIATGVRSAGGVGPNEHGVMFYIESQGPWNGSCSLKHLKPGGFMGHPICFDGYDLPLGKMLGPKPLEPKNQSRLYDEAKRIEQLVPYAVVFPYRRMGQSITAFRPDRSEGRFGPFQNQLFVGDYSLSIVMRATTEEVEGVWQGACYPFKEGFATGILATELSNKGYLITGGTNRGWPVRGNRKYLLQRLEWTGLTPFEVKLISARKNGFAVTFTKPVNAAIAQDVRNYKMRSFTHIFQKFYGSPEVDETFPVVTDAAVSSDRLTVTITVKGLVEGHVHDFDFTGIRSAGDEPLVHQTAHYTLNRIPK